MIGNVAEGVDLVQFYAPGGGTRSSEVYVRGKGDGTQTARHLEEAWRQMAAPNEVATVVSVEQRRYWDTYPARAFSWVASLLGVIALVLTMSGLYGVISFLVSQRTKEFGVRLALGATQWRVVRYVVAQSGRLAGVGLAVGVFLAVAVSKLMWSQAPMVHVVEPIAYGVALGVVIMATLVASAGPAWRAGRVNPSHIARAE
jgi:predicted lysophospholipase L1 biosynthesis ABC-type transport system permease subunit